MLQYGQRYRLLKDILSRQLMDKIRRHKQLRTSNGIERLNEELRRRERVIRIFPNEASMIRLMGAVLMEHHEKWSSVKKYFTMDCYFAEREEARKTALAERSKRIHTIY